MHRCCFFHQLYIVPIYITLRIFKHFFHENLYSLTGTLNMSACTEVSTFNHFRKSKYHLVLYFLNMLCLLLYLLFKIAVILFKKVCIFTFFGLINYYNLITLNSFFITDVIDNKLIKSVMMLNNMLYLFHSCSALTVLCNPVELIQPSVNKRQRRLIDIEPFINLLICKCKEEFSGS